MYCIQEEPEVQPAYISVHTIVEQDYTFMTAKYARPPGFH